MVASVRTAHCDLATNKTKSSEFMSQDPISAVEHQDEKDVSSYIYQSHI